MLGATGIGAPPIILYLLSGPDPVAVTRANLTTYVTIISVFGLVMLWASGILNWKLSLFAFLLAPFFLASMWIGSGVFSRMTAEGFRRDADCTHPGFSGHPRHLEELSRGCLKGRIQAWEVAGHRPSYDRRGADVGHVRQILDTASDEHCTLG